MLYFKQGKNQIKTTLGINNNWRLIFLEVKLELLSRYLYPSYEFLYWLNENESHTIGLGLKPYDLFEQIFGINWFGTTNK